MSVSPDDPKATLSGAADVRSPRAPIARGGMGKYFEGWEAGLVAVLVAGLGAALAIPWSVSPRELPLPEVDERPLLASLAADRARAAKIGPLLLRDDGGPSGLYDLRALGSAIRDFGRAEVKGDVPLAYHVRRTLGALVGAARAVGDERVLELRAFEQQMFLTAIEQYEKTRIVSVDLDELGGSFVAASQANGWVDEAGRVTMPETLRAVMFRKRWGELTGLSTAPFAPLLDEQKAFYRFALDHPPRLGDAGGSPQEMCEAIDRWRLRKVDELAATDATYPRALARGVIFARLGEYPAAAQAFRDHLAGPNGAEYATLARNYLRFAVDRARMVQ